ncbi:efflux RND transporter periplasmic adaptor subunit [Desulforamulus ruminis]|uniref:Efflux transporter, RND family, MFP subunit n=1 Tax=Desulforamulus ruminis (strain ATCC 23193 / DSM 2154 / NCIMB 8452 / DL) TaxID=696281 RepID=F6DPT7_DESRL|nr:efflux RND transporter periplasmic adaptor subunit [Desulforamulus ruminis]AEG60776.1 efflux transporter, RND family, MFP subunit [Desulforamulus ruminis DSM 2154]
MNFFGQKLRNSFRNKSKPLLSLLAVLLIVGILYEFNARESIKNANASTQFQVVTRGDITEKISASGTVQSPTQVKLSFVAGNTGRLSSIKVKIGSTVQTGDVLATLDDRTARAQLTTARANLESAIAKLNQAKQGATSETIAVQQTNAEKARVALEGAKKAYENQLVLYNDRTQARQQVVHAESQLEQAQIQLRSAKAGLASAQSKLDASRELASLEAVEAARANLEAAESQYINALQDQKAAQDTLTTALNQTPPPENVSELKNTAEAAQSALNQAEATRTKARKQLTDLSGQANDYAVSQAEAARDQAQAAVEQAENTLRTAQGSLELAKESYANRSQDKAQLDQVKNQMDQAQATYNTAVAQLNQTLAPADRESIRIAQAAVDQARVQVQQQEIALDNLILKAPMDGIIAQINGNIGELTSAGQPVIVMNDSNAHTLQVMAQISQNDVTKIMPGQSADITTTAVQGKNFKGTVLVVYPEAITQNGVTNYSVLLSVENSAGQLKPGMTTNVSINTGTHKNVLYVPMAALKELNGSDGVYLAHKDGELRFQPVTIGLFGLDKVEIIAGLQEGDQVAVSLTNDSGKKSFSLWGGFGGGNR